MSTVSGLKAVFQPVNAKNVPIDVPLLMLSVDSVALQGDLAEKLVEEAQETRVIGAEGLLHERRLLAGLFAVQLERLRQCGPKVKGRLMLEFL